jgi:hypothetical protein
MKFLKANFLGPKLNFTNTPENANKTKKIKKNYKNGMYK